MKQCGRYIYILQCLPSIFLLSFTSQRMALEPKTDSLSFMIRLSLFDQNSCNHNSTFEKVSMKLLRLYLNEQAVHISSSLSGQIGHPITLITTPWKHQHGLIISSTQNSCSITASIFLVHTIALHNTCSKQGVFWQNEIHWWLIIYFQNN